MTISIADKGQQAIILPVATAKISPTLKKKWDWLLSSSGTHGPTISKMQQERKEQDSMQESRLGTELPAGTEIQCLIETSSSKVEQTAERNEDIVPQYD